MSSCARYSYLEEQEQARLQRLDEGDIYPKKEKEPELDIKALLLKMIDLINLSTGVGYSGYAEDRYIKLRDELKEALK